MPESRETGFAEAETLALADRHWLPADFARPLPDAVKTAKFPKTSDQPDPHIGKDQTAQPLTGGDDGPIAGEGQLGPLPLGEGESPMHFGGHG